MSYISDNSYLAIKPEVTAGTAILPTIFVPLVSSNVKTVVNHTADRRLKGVNWKANDLLRGNRSHEGEIVVLGDPDTLGHVLNLFMTKGSTTGSAPAGYTHPFTVGAGKTYTMDIKKGLYVQRYVGVKVDEVKVEFSDGQMQLTLSIKAQAQCGVFTLGVALTGAGMTAATFDDEYDINPSYGLVVGDIVVTAGGTEMLVATVTATGITFTTTPVTAVIGDALYLKPQTVTQSTLYDPFYLGNCLVGFGVDSTAATTAAGSRTTATPVYDFTISFKLNLFAQNGTNRLDPVQILPRTREASVALKQLFENASQRQAFQDRKKQAMTVIISGKAIQADFATKELCTIKFNNVKLLEHDNMIEVGEYIVDDEQFEVLYDNTDGKAMTIDLVNRSAGTVY